MLRLFPDRAVKGEDELAIGKARFKVAAAQALPTDIVRRHPLSSLVGTFSVGIIAGILLGRERVRHVVERQANGKSASFGTSANGAAPQKANWIGPLIGMGSSLLQAYITRQMASARHTASAQTAAKRGPTEGL